MSKDPKDILERLRKIAKNPDIERTPTGRPKRRKTLAPKPQKAALEVRPVENKLPVKQAVKALFEKGGPSGNPAGRPPQLKNLKGLCKQYGKEAIQTVRNIMKAPKARPGDKLKAAELILAYGFGRPQNNHAITHEHVRSMSDKQLAQAIVEAKEALMDQMHPKELPPIDVEYEEEEPTEH